tara:strand:+ start:222389 stop:223639 length:1251 start_codon:yes stop_codon:yes gene_type:complete
MYDQSYISHNLIKIGSPVFEKAKRLDPALEKENEIKKAKSILEENVRSPAIDITKIKGKKIFHIMEPVVDVVYRKTGHNIINTFPNKQKKRDYIIGNSLKHLRESTPFEVYRRDIKDFYASIEPDWIIENLISCTHISNKTTAIVENFFKYFSIFETGLPRGLYLSAILSEFSMKDLDNHLINHPKVFFYARYVDDILLIADPIIKKEKFWKNSELFLPAGVSFHDKEEKCNSISLSRTGPVAGKNVNDAEGKFNFLGYDISCLVSPSYKKRELKVDMSEKKINRYKTKVTLALMDFIKNNNYPLLQERIKLLTSNYYIYNSYSKRHMEHGIYCSSKFLNVDFCDPDNSLNKLDKYLKNLLLSNRSPIGISLRGSLTNRQRKNLLRFSFKRGYENKIFYNFSPKEYNRIRECWKNV